MDTSGWDSAPAPLEAVEEVVQAKFIEERARQAKKPNLKVRGLPLPHPSPDPVEVEAIILQETLTSLMRLLTGLGLDLTTLSFFSSSVWLIHSETLVLNKSPSLPTKKYFLMKISQNHSSRSLNTPMSWL